MAPNTHLRCNPSPSHFTAPRRNRNQYLPLTRTGRSRLNGPARPAAGWLPMTILILHPTRLPTPRKWEAELVGSSSCKLIQSRDAPLRSALFRSSVLMGIAQVTACIHVVLCTGSVLQLFNIRCYRIRSNSVSSTSHCTPCCSNTDANIIQAPRLLERSPVHASRCRGSSLYVLPTAAQQQGRIYLGVKRHWEWCQEGGWRTRSLLLPVRCQFLVF